MRQSGGSYPHNWNEIALKVKQEADWKCVRCGHSAEIPSERKPCDRHCDLDRHPEFAELPTDKMRESMRSYLSGDSKAKIMMLGGRQRVLTVHHLDGDKTNSAWWNLCALCQVCHLSIQGRVKMEQLWFLEHSEWFKPYAAGYYASVNGLPTDKEYVYANMDRLLELAYEQT